MITTELKKWADEQYHHAEKESLLNAVSEVMEKEHSIRDAFKSEAFRQRMTDIIESKTMLRYPESMHVVRDIEDAIFDVLDI
jgi:hypothetical protein